MEQDHRQVIAIDGPAAAGKTTVAAAVADQLDALLFDTGAIYRAVTLASVGAGIEPSDEQALRALAQTIQISLRTPSVNDGRHCDVWLDGEDVTWAIRSQKVDAEVSAVAALPGVRTALLSTQRDIADGTRVVMVGRDIGTVVVPDAGVKIFLDASAEVRARRRVNELHKRGETITYEEVLADLIARDAWDSSRETAPLRAAEDAVIVNTDDKSIEQVVAEIVNIARTRWEHLAVAV